MPMVKSWAMRNPCPGCCCWRWVSFCLISPLFNTAEVLSPGKDSQWAGRYESLKLKVLKATQASTIRRRIRVRRSHLVINNGISKRGEPIWKSLSRVFGSELGAYGVDRDRGEMTVAEEFVDHDRFNEIKQCSSIPKWYEWDASSIDEINVWQGREHL